jgi:hypothetical protein
VALQAPVSEANLVALGRVTVNFALLEAQLRMLAGELIGPVCSSIEKLTGSRTEMLTTPR